MRCRWMALVALFVTAFWPPPGLQAKDCIIDSSFKTSSTLMIEYSLCRTKAAPPDKAEEASKRHMLLSDIYIKANSYSMLNKIFFWLSIAFGIAVLLWPSLSVIFKDRFEKWEWVKSATVQTTVTGLAALMFMFYSSYKEKQTYAESLMRHVVVSDKGAAELSTKVAEELSRIDRGFSFSSILGEGDDGK